MTTTQIVEVNGQSIDLPILQDKIKRQPDLYRNEFTNCLEIFKKLLPDLRDNPAKEQPTVCSFLMFFTHLFDRFPKDLQFLSNELINVVEQYYAILNVATRNTCVQCLITLRTKNLISPVL
jgi:protein SDA1